ncbi:MAG: DUF748 domain-containing protein [Candidatus Binataceae bacterium]
MDEPLAEGAAKSQSWRSRATALARIRWLRRLLIGLAAFFIFFTVLGFFIIPLILRHVLSVQVAASLKRPVTVGAISFNPYTLRLEAGDLHIGGLASAEPFIDLGHLYVHASWASLYHLAPVVKEVTLTRPVIHLVRTAPQRFNFSDLLEHPGPPPPPPPEPPKPFRFAVSNIQVKDGDVQFDDRVLNQHHSVQNIQLGVPFIANLPADIDTTVQPLLQMDVDGSPIRIAGKAKPFTATPESIINLEVDHFALPPYAGYIPFRLPVKIASGGLSADLQVHFVKTEPEPAIAIAGTVTLDQFSLHDSADAPLIELKQMVAPLNDVEPLANVIRLGAIKFDGLAINAILNGDGTTNFTALTAAKAASSNAPAVTSAQPSPAQAPAVIATASPTIAAAIASPSPVARLAVATPTALATAAASPTASAGMVTPASTPAASPSTTVTPTVNTPAATPAAAAALPQSITAEPPGAIATPAPSSATPEAHPLDLTLDSFALTNSTVNLTDRALPSPVQVALQAIQIGLGNFAICPRAAPASYNFAANLSTGGSLATKGTIDLVKSQSSSDVSLSQIDLPALQGFAQAFLAGSITSGKLNAQASVKEAFAPGHINVHVEPATIALDDFAAQYPNSRDQPIKWKRISTTIGSVDLAAHHATIDEVRSDAIQLDVRHLRDGSFSLEALLRHAPSSTPRTRTIARTQRRRKAASEVRGLVRNTPPPPPAPSGSPAWTYNVKTIALEQTSIGFQDETTAKPVKVTLAPLNVHVQNVSDSLAKPITVNADSTVNAKGGFTIAGTVIPQPLKANLKVITRRLDLAVANPYIASEFNASIARALLTMNAQVSAATVRNKLQLGYEGEATLGAVKLIDKVTNEDFVRWNSFNAKGINVRIGEGEPRVHISGLALSNFYARIILNQDGKLNLNDITANPKAAPTSLTREHKEALATAAPSPGPAAATGPAAAPAPVRIPADIAIGETTLDGGHINWTDDFIKPNYTADLTDLGGHIGTISTRGEAPAAVDIHGDVNEVSPIAITGSINPLAPATFIDITAKADDVELANMSAYSTKYTGYPIIRGTLSVNVHYLLQQNNLTAQNHILLNQLTFGDKVTTPGAGNLPVRLAVAILKDSKGQISLDIPVSGSLSDPQFSIGSVIWHAISNLLVKAVTAPFSLIAGAFSGHSSQSVNYIAFKPGFATLTIGGKQQLDEAAKALQARPSLRLVLTGRVDPAVDHDGLREAMLDHAMREQKLKATGATNIEDVTIDPDEYNKYLTRAYKAAKFPKPKDLVGMAKSLPPDEMTKLMLANAKVTDEDMKNLAIARAEAVKAYLAKAIDPSRITIAPPKLDASGINDGGKTTRVDLSLE